uniref:Uncharacterized protein n=1 Tax=Glossina palpalis gambiensis TaxID=67801 RepID=A0A1B0BG03_9MUSC
MTELCFDRWNICVHHCLNKYARFTQAMMRVYVEVQTQLNQKRLKELEEQQKLPDQKLLHYLLAQLRNQEL